MQPAARSLGCRLSPWQQEGWGRVGDELVGPVGPGRVYNHGPRRRPRQAVKGLVSCSEHLCHPPSLLQTFLEASVATGHLKCFITTMM